MASLLVGKRGDAQAGRVPSACLLKQMEVWVSSPALPKASLSVQPQMGALVLPATEDQGTICHVQEWFVPSWTPGRSLLSLP